MCQRGFCYINIFYLITTEFFRIGFTTQRATSCFDNDLISSYARSFFKDTIFEEISNFWVIDK